MGLGPPVIELYRQYPGAVGNQTLTSAEIEFFAGEIVSFWEWQRAKQ